MLTDKQVTIIGAGIAGLTCAIAMAQRGARVRVLEQSAEISEVGAGLQITPNGVAVLDALGLGKKLRSIGMKPNSVTLCDFRRGKQVARLDMTKSGDGRPYLLLHRADLIELLAQAAKKTGATIEVNRAVISVAPGPDLRRVFFERGQEDCPGLLIGADGLHSRMRKTIESVETAIFTGQVAWRALVNGSASNSVNVYMGPGKHLVSYPLRGGKLTNVVGIEERSKQANEGWGHPSNPDEFRSIFARFCPEVRQLLEQVDSVKIWGLYRHPVAKNWTGDGCALIGDAAHPTLPFLAQGANMALEDAWVLADCLGSMPEPDALAAYQRRRYARVSKIVAAATANARNYHLRNPLVRFAAHSGLRAVNAVAPAQLLGRFDWVYGYDVTQPDG